MVVMADERTEHDPAGSIESAMGAQDGGPSPAELSLAADGARACALVNRLDGLGGAITVDHCSLRDADPGSLKWSRFAGDVSAPPVTSYAERLS